MKRFDQHRLSTTDMLNELTIDEKELILRTAIEGNDSMLLAAEEGYWETNIDTLVCSDSFAECSLDKRKETLELLRELKNTNVNITYIVFAAETRIRERSEQNEQDIFQKPQ